MILKLFLGIFFFIWNAESQNPFSYQPNTPYIDYMEIFFRNLRNNAQRSHYGNPFNVSDDVYSQAYANNVGQKSINNGFIPDNRGPNNQLTVQTQQPFNKETSETNYQTRSAFNTDSKNVGQINNGFVPNNRVSYNQPKLQQTQAPIYRQTNEPNYQTSSAINNDSKYVGQLNNRFFPDNSMFYNQPKSQQTQAPIYKETNKPNHFETQTITETTPQYDVSSKFGKVETGKTSQNANVNNSTLAITNFSLKLFKGMNSNRGNIVASPYSVAILLALIQQGALGQTQEEISQLLQMTPETSADLFKGLTDVIKKRSFQNILKIANNVVLANAFNINSKFKSNAIYNFGSDVTRKNFNNPSKATQEINEWVAHKTNQKILNLLPPEAVQPDTQAVLVNAVYFKGIWDTKFRVEATTTKQFNLSNGLKKPVPFMQARRMFQTDTDRNIKSQVLLMPFVGKEYSMVIILPFEEVSVSDVLSSLTVEQLYAYQTITAKEVQLEIPRFTVKTDSDIGFVLNSLGLWSMFSNEANLSGIGSYEGISPRISTGVHSAVLSIDEQGGSAAAATAFSVVALSYDDPPISFEANRPFLAVLWDNQLSMPLFMAKIEDPQA